MTLSLLSSGVVNIFYEFANETIERPFEVPHDIIDVDKGDLMTDGMLCDYL